MFNGDKMENKRLTAVKVPIKDIIQGKYYQQEGFNPNFIITKSNMKVSRTRLTGTIVNKYASPDNKFASITLDDATATIRAKAFGNIDIFSKVEVGDIVDVIGKVRLYEDEIHLVVEIAHKIDDPNFETLRKLELKIKQNDWNKKKQKLFELREQTADLAELKQAAAVQLLMDEDVVEAIVSDTPEQAKEKKPDIEDRDELKKKMLDLISKCDSGDGCLYNELVDTSGMDEYAVESVVSELLEDGECFEPKPGKIKRL